MKIGIVNDLPMAVVAIRHALAATTRHEVSWVAQDGAEAVELCLQNKPDLVLMDLIMPVMDGVEATRRIMAQTPCAILVVTATVDGNSSKVFEALGAGALDAVNTPVLGAAPPHQPTVLLDKIDLLGKLISGGDRKKALSSSPPASSKFSQARQDRLVAIGASAGGPMALAKVLDSLPVDFPAAIVIVQHVDPQFAPGLAGWLAQHSFLPVRLARQGDNIVPGTVLVAGTGDHLVFTDGHTLGYTPSPLDYVYRPSVDVFFESVTRHWQGEVVGVLLTGMGRDGALGLKMLRDAGRHTIAQDRASSIVYGMPKAAADLGAAAEILPLDKIGLTLKNIFIPSSSKNEPVIL
jgi:chemotaxis response regulator CheB